MSYYLVLYRRTARKADGASLCQYFCVEAQRSRNLGASFFHGTEGPLTQGRICANVQGTIGSARSALGPPPSTAVALCAGPEACREAFGLAIRLGAGPNQTTSIWNYFLGCYHTWHETLSSDSVLMIARAANRAECTSFGAAAQTSIFFVLVRGSRQVPDPTLET